MIKTPLTLAVLALLSLEAHAQVETSEEPSKSKLITTHPKVEDFDDKPIPGITDNLLDPEPLKNPSLEGPSRSGTSEEGTFMGAYSQPHLGNGLLKK